MVLLLSINYMFSLFVKCYTENYFNFSDRANRKEYISFILFYGLISLIYSIITIVFGYSLNLVSLFFIIKIFLLIPFISLTSRRLLDLEYSRLFILILIPVIVLTKYLSYPISLVLMGFVSPLLYIKGTDDASNKNRVKPKY
jgi:uncharacterized membrane protein YhaH (DUF805 family)